jgi:hypothetical protein
MALRVCYYADHFEYPEGGYLWKFLNWARGLAANGCEVIWLEAVSPERSPEEIAAAVAALRSTLAPYGLGDSLSICRAEGDGVAVESACRCVPLETAVESDLFLSVGYYRPTQRLVDRFRRSAFVDYDPGLLQLWLSRRSCRIATYDVYFTIGETVGRPGSLIPDVGLDWHYVPPCVSLEEWTPAPPPAGDAAFTTITHWWGDWVEDYDNTKRAGFLPYLEMPGRSPRPLELAVFFPEDQAEARKERDILTRHGWRLRQPSEIAATPDAYRRYIRGSLGEFSCAKPSGPRLQNAWVSERTLSYLATGRPAVVEHTGPSRFLPDAAGVWRFRNVSEATRALQRVVEDYPNQCRQARALAEEHFDARQVVARVLDVALA